MGLGELFDVSGLGAGCAGDFGVAVVGAGGAAGGAVMGEQERAGLMLLCGLCAAPGVLGFALGWWWRGRVLAFGRWGAFVPGWLRDRLNSL